MRLLHRTELSEANDKLLAVQECYISVCREKDMLEERMRRAEEENSTKEKEVGSYRYPFTVRKKKNDANKIKKLLKESEFILAMFAH